MTLASIQSQGLPLVMPISPVPLHLPIPRLLASIWLMQLESRTKSPTYMSHFYGLSRIGNKVDKEMVGIEMKAMMMQTTTGEILKANCRMPWTRERVFFKAPPSWYLYVWELANKFQLLDSTLQQLSDRVGTADSSLVTSVSCHCNRNNISPDRNLVNGEGTSWFNG